jgi:phospholipase/lecithinase/hemolysin
MIIRPQLILTFLACGAATCSLSGQALSGSYTALYAFGDSLSDAGNVFAVTSMTSPLPAFYTDGTVTGRFTNGLNWVDITSQRLGLGTSVPFALGGNNLAWGGAMTGSGLTSAGIPNVGTQIGQYLTDRGSFPAQSLITLWAGANDYLGGGVQDPQAVVNNLLQHLATMYQFGGRHFVVGNLPDLGQTPLAAFTLDEQGRMGLSMLVAGHNALLAAGIAEFRLNNADVVIHELDAFGMMNDLIANPASYGLANVTLPVYTGSSSQPGTLIGNPADFLFFDALHPTAVAHGFLAIPEPAHVGLAMLVFALGLALYRRRR